MTDSHCHGQGHGVPSRLAIVLAALAAIALLGAFVEQQRTSAPATTTTAKLTRRAHEHTFA